jgi:hypothetical protein
MNEFQCIDELTTSVIEVGWGCDCVLGRRTGDEREGRNKGTIREENMTSVVEGRMRKRRKEKRGSIEKRLKHEGKKAGRKERWT